MLSHRLMFLSGPAAAYALTCGLWHILSLRHWWLEPSSFSGVLGSFWFPVGPQWFFFVVELINAWKAVKMNDAHWLRHCIVPVTNNVTYMLAQCSGHMIESGSISFMRWWTGEWMTMFRNKFREERKTDLYIKMDERMGDECLKVLDLIGMVGKAQLL